VLNYFVQKFMAHLKATEGFIVHKKTLKLSKGKKYKDPKKGMYLTKLPYFFIPVHMRKMTFVETRAEAMKAAKEQPEKMKNDFGIGDITKAAQAPPKDDGGIKDLRMPGSV